MKQFFVISSLLVLNSLLASTAFAAPANNVELGVFPTSLNVKDFGAKGDGIADDTRAIQAAVSAGIAQSSKWPSEVRHWNHLKKGISDNPHSEIVFPSGTYNISSPIVFTRYSSLRGVGQTVIRQTDPAKDSFYFHGLLRSTVENLHFEGGKIQLRFWTANNGTARVSVKHCTFSNSGSYAIECDSQATAPRTDEASGSPKRWSPYEVEWLDGVPKITANAPENLQLNNNSTFANIVDCRFENVMGAAHLSGDTSVIQDCEVTVNPNAEGGIFRLMGLMHLQRIKGTARPAPGKHQYWIETEGRYREITLRNSELDSSPGLCLVRSKAQHINSSIILQDSRVNSASSPEGALIWLGEDTQPSIIAIRGVQETSGQPIKAIAWEKMPDESFLKDTGGEFKYAITMTGNSPNIQTTVPKLLQPLVLEPVPEAELKATFLPDLSWNYDDLEAQALATGRVIQATAYGVDQDPKTDDTAAVQKAFDAAKQSLSLIIFPAGVITLSDTIQLPQNVVVRSAGVTSFTLPDTQKDIFSAAGAQTIAFKNCDFSGGRNALNLRSDATAKARLAFDNCAFYDQEENGINALAGKGEISESNQTELFVQGGIFATMRAITTNATHSQLESFWAINDPRLNEDGFIRNLGGSMKAQTIMFNPTLWQGERSKTPTDIKDWKLSKNTRWFDNWGKLYSLDNRFGGESGGMTNVYNRSAEGMIHIEGGITRFYNGATRKAMLYLEKEPRRAILRDVSGMERRSELVVMNRDGSDGRKNANVIMRGLPK